MPIIPQSLRRPARELFWFVLLPFHLTLSTSILLNDAVLEFTSIHGSSMAPTLSPSFDTSGARDTVAWDKRRAGVRGSALRRGDLVFFAAPHRADGLAVKRVVALPGDTVLLDPRRRPAPEFIAAGRENPEASRWDRWEGRVRVPAGHVWVEGDNWRRTKDSNSYGPISGALLRGKAVAVVWPFERMGTRPWEGFRSRTRVLHGRGDWEGGEAGV